MRKVVAILAMPRVYALDVSIPEHVFGRHQDYRVVVCGDVRGDVSADVVGGARLADVESADIVVVPGYEDPHVPVPDAYLKALRIAVERGARVVAICTGVFALAACGILNEKSATTHWHHTDELRLAYPRVDVVDNRLFVEDGAILTCAGGGAGIDACLHVVETDFGPTVADAVAKDLVFSSSRGANEPQYNESQYNGPQYNGPQYRDVPMPPRDSLWATREWVIDNLSTSITVQQLADRSLLSRRTLVRRFVRETGLPPMQWVALQRILRARRLLEGSDLSVERIAGATGFGSAANFRTIFRREVGVTPTAYRKQHG